MVPATPAAREVKPEFDPRLAEVYDAECPWGPDDDFFVDVARRGRRLLDLGCGTGRLTCALALAGHDVTGIDPNPASLAWARGKPGAERVRWIEGTSSDAPQRAFDVALMTSHVSQVFVTDAAWAATLRDVRAALVDDGVLAFDMRNPAARAWESWTEAATRGEVALSDGSGVQTWVEVENVVDNVVTFTWANGFADGAFVGGSDSLRFRTYGELVTSLLGAGFVVTECYGDFVRTPFTTAAHEIVVVATAR